MGLDPACASFLSALFHELRTPLSSVLMQVELLEPGGDPRAAQGLNRIRRATEDLVELIDGVHYLARLGQGRVRPSPDRFDLRELEASRDVGALRWGRDGPSVHWELPSRPVEVVSDRALLTKLLAGVLGSCLRVSREEVRVLVRPAGSRPDASIEVSDDGPPLPEPPEAIFEPFRRGEARCARRHGGLGIELTVAAALAELLGGRLEAHPREGRSVFRLALPA